MCLCSLGLYVSCGVVVRMRALNPSTPCRVSDKVDLNVGRWHRFGTVEGQLFH
jgi:hypothetical protein